MKVGACSSPQEMRRLVSSRAVCVGSNGETALVRARAWFNGTTAGRLSNPLVVEVGEVPLGLAPALGGDPEGDVAAAVAVDRPVGGEDGLDPGLDQRLMPGAGGADVGEVPHHLPAVVAGVVDVDRRLPRPGTRPPPAGDPVPQAHLRWSAAGLRATGGAPDRADQGRRAEPLAVPKASPRTQRCEGSGVPSGRAETGG